MVDQENRDVMTAVYRLMETYEQPPDNIDTDEALLAYFTRVSQDIQTFYSEYWDRRHNLFAREMAGALYRAISDRFAKHRDEQKQQSEVVS